MIKRYLALLTAVNISVVFLCACKENRTKNIPKLVEPKATTFSYRTVTKELVGDVETLVGTTVSKEYGNYFDSTVTVSKIIVKVGDYVKKGDVLAYADIKEVNEQIKQMENEIKHKNYLFDLNTKLHRENNKLLAQDKVGMAVENENYSYDSKLYRYEIKELEKKLAELKKLAESGVLKSNHNGRVSYVKNISFNAQALPMENVVVVADKKDKYIELEMNLQNYPFEKCEYKYIKVGNKNIEVKEMGYSSKEQIVAGISKRYPNIRFEIPSGINMEPGENCTIYFAKSRGDEALAVCNDSIYREEDKKYVYVLGKDKKREKRYINVGKSDRYYTEVISGLKIDELVYYESQTSIPNVQNVNIAKESEFIKYNYSKTYEIKDYYSESIVNDVEGIVDEICISAKNGVKKGDLLCVIDTGKGKADLANSKKEIERENRSYLKQINEFEKERKDIDKSDKYAAIKSRIIEINSKIAEENHTYTIQSLEKEYNSIAKNNDGMGKISIYAKKDGIVSDVKIEKNQRVLEGEELFLINVPKEESLMVFQKEEKDLDVINKNIADYQEKVVFEKDGKEFVGRCIGYTVNSINNEDKCFISSSNKKPVVSFNTASGYDAPAFYVELENESDNDLLRGCLVKFPYIYLKGAIVIPSKYVYKETQGTTKGCNYVWRKTNGRVIKQYVLVNDELSTKNEIVILSGLEDGAEYVCGE
ncbi:MAG: efflux RND transporter periplasmic adaptor subunit [Lachnospiraceae bacterium]|nr:efflux RND transporter periplasmic adaptor subunit [Lachnospiraceae bacterium]